MSEHYSVDQLVDIIGELTALPSEMSWLEFKSNYSDPVGIGRYLSGLSNSAALEGKARGFMIWGVSDCGNTIMGTDIDFLTLKKGNEDLIPWLTRGLDPQINFELDTVTFKGKRLVVLSIAAASHRPVRFMTNECIRVGSYLKELREYPDYERRLWQRFSSSPFESGVARDRVSEEGILRALDYAAYYDLIERPIPVSISEILETLEAEGLIVSSYGGIWSITNLGAILFALDLKSFPGLSRKAARIISYDGKDRSASATEQIGGKGYASGFRGLLSYVEARVPSQEVFESGIRRNEPLFPEKAIRELVVNALIHQDFSISGNGPVVDIFTDRVEITNPGTSLVEASRFIDAAPRSRNEVLASLARRLGLCEERGSGWDQVAALVEANDLPAPFVEATEEFVRVTVFAHRPLNVYSKEERVRALYFHACLRHVRYERTTNTSVRARFRIGANDPAKASRLIKDAVESGVIVPYDATVGAKAMSYVPFWASPTR